MPRQHIDSLNALSPEHDALVGEMVRRAAALARERGYADGGFRTVFNTNADAGQTVFHIHLHLLAGRGLTWPPGIEAEQGFLFLLPHLTAPFQQILSPPSIPAQ